METPIFGPFDVSRSTNFADNRLINLYPELSETRQGKRVGALFATPGLDFLDTFSTDPVQGLHVMDPWLFAVAGGKLYQITTGYIATALGSVAFGETSFIDNGTQLAVFTGASAYLWSSAGGLSSIALPYTNPGTPIRATYQDGFGLITQPGTNEWFQSDLLNLATWQALNFASASGDPDSVLTIKQIHREIWLLKEFETEIWYNAGTTGFAFARLDGVYIEVGIQAISSLTRIGESLLWLGQTKQGGGIVFETRGHAATRISTHPVESAIQSAGPAAMSAASAYSYQQQGHQFYVLSVGDRTFAYDVTQSALAGAPMWHERAAFSGGSFHRHWADCHAFFNGRNIVGDYRSGTIYALNPTTLLDNATPRKWLRTWRALPKPAETPMRFSNLRIDMQTGINIDPSSNPQVVLRWSDDGGHLWSDERFQSAGKEGQTAQRVLFQRLGSTRRNSGLDRIFELSSSDAFPAVIVGAELS